MVGYIYVGLIKVASDDDNTLVVPAAIIFGIFSAFTAWFGSYLIRFNRNFDYQLKAMAIVDKSPEDVRETEDEFTKAVVVPDDQRWAGKHDHIPAEHLQRAKRLLVRFKAQVFCHAIQDKNYSHEDLVELMRMVDDGTAAFVHNELESRELNVTSEVSGPNAVARRVKDAGFNLYYLLIIANQYNSRNQIPLNKLIDLERLLVDNDKEYQEALEEIKSSPVIAGLDEFRETFLAAVSKTTRHDFIQTSFKLACGALAWQWFFMLSQLALGDEYETGFVDVNWPYKIIAWIASGVGATLGINAGIAIVQKILYHRDGGIPINRYVKLLLQLSVSVTLADALWQPLTDVILMSMSAMGVSTLTASFLVLPIAILLYGVQSFIFKNVHNALNPKEQNAKKQDQEVEASSDNQILFNCDYEFTGVLFGAYFGFNYMVTLLGLMVGGAPIGLTASAIAVNCALAFAGTAILPMIIGYGNMQRKYAEAEDCFDKLTYSVEELTGSGESKQADEESQQEENDKTKPLLSSEETSQDSFGFKKHGCAAPCVWFSNAVNTVIRNSTYLFPT